MKSKFMRISRQFWNLDSGRGWKGMGGDARGIYTFLGRTILGWNHGQRCPNLIYNGESWREQESFCPRE